MKNSISCVLAGLLAFASASCIYVRVKGDLEELDSDGDFAMLSRELESSICDPAYDLDIDANLWRTKAQWTIRFADEGSDPERAFRQARQAVLRRIDREGGDVTDETSESAVAWSCSFELHNEPGEASVRLFDDRSDEERPQRLQIRWKESN